jgi:hypothetical protein
MNNELTFCQFMDTTVAVVDVKTLGHFSKQMVGIAQGVSGIQLREAPSTPRRRRCRCSHLAETERGYGGKGILPHGRPQSEGTARRGGSRGASGLAVRIRRCGGRLAGRIGRVPSARPPEDAGHQRRRWRRGGEEGDGGHGDWIGKQL